MVIEGVHPRILYQWVESDPASYALPPGCTVMREGDNCGVVVKDHIQRKAFPHRLWVEREAVKLQRHYDGNLPTRLPDVVVIEARPQQSASSQVAGSESLRRYPAHDDRTSQVLPKEKTGRREDAKRRRSPTPSSSEVSSHGSSDSRMSLPVPSSRSSSSKPERARKRNTSSSNPPDAMDIMQAQATVEKYFAARAHRYSGKKVSSAAASQLAALMCDRPREMLEAALSGKKHLISFITHPCIRLPPHFACPYESDGNCPLKHQPIMACIPYLRSGGRCRAAHCEFEHPAPPSQHTKGSPRSSNSYRPVNWDEEEDPGF